jgi:hypothetical protein
MDADRPTFFCGKNIGKNTKEVSVDLVETENDKVISRWYQGPNVDFYTWISSEDNRVLKQQMNFNGQIVEWNSRDGLKTGVTIEDDLGQSKTYNEEGKLEKPGHISQSIKFDPSPMTNCVAWAIEILESIPLENNILQKLLVNFKSFSSPSKSFLRKIIK